MGHRIGRKYAQATYPEPSRGGTGTSCIQQIGYDAPDPTAGPLDLIGGYFPRTALTALQIDLPGVVAGNTIEVDFIAYVTNLDNANHTLILTIGIFAPAGYFITGGIGQQTIITPGEVAMLRPFTAFEAAVSDDYSIRIGVATDGGAGDLQVNGTASSFMRATEIAPGCISQPSPIQMLVNPP